MIANKSFGLIITGILTIFLMGCSILGNNLTSVDQSAPDVPPQSNANNTSDSTGEGTLTVGTEAIIDTVELLILESFPVQVNAVIRGKLPPGCIKIERLIPERQRDAFLITITTSRLNSNACSQEEHPFEEVVALDVAGLAAGAYPVTVKSANSIASAFALDNDNIAPSAAETDTAMGTDTAYAAIDGVVWDDTCRLSEDEAPTASCVAGEGGDYGPNGLLNEDEARLANVLITLKAGDCSGNEATFATTDIDGTYQFANLEPGTYCVSVDPLVDQNVDLLLPGDWTYPDLGLGALTVTVEAGETKRADFGWAYTLDTDRTEDAVAEIICVDQAAYVADVTIPDDTVIRAGETFTKTWRIRNIGNCAWGPSYTFIFTGGDQMDGPVSMPLQAIVPPDEEIDLSVPLIAPLDNGAYRGDWALQNREGETFGSRGGYPFYVQIVVNELPEPSEEPAGTEDDSAAEITVIQGSVWDDVCQTQADGFLSEGCIPADDGSYRADGLMGEDELGIAGVLITLSLGECPGSDIIRTATTEADGTYRFDNIQSGALCVAIDASDEQNAAILLAGHWTHPAYDLGSSSITINQNESKTVNFGWQRQQP